MDRRLICGVLFFFLFSVAVFPLEKDDDFKYKALLASIDSLRQTDYPPSETVATRAANDKMIILLNDSAIFYLQAKRYEVSDSFFEKTVAICFNGACKNLSVYGGRLAKVLHYWGKAHFERGEWNAAGNLYNKAWKVYMVLPAVYRNDANFLELMMDYGCLYDRCKLPQKAEEMCTSALPIIEKLKNKYKGKYDFEEAERLYGELKNELDDLGRPLRKELLRKLKFLEEKGFVPELYKADFERMKVFLSLK